MRRSSRVQTSIPFTSLRFARPRLPTAGRSVSIVAGLIALGLAVAAIRSGQVANATLAQTEALLSISTKGAVTGQLAADQMAAQARVEAAQALAAQDAASRLPPPRYLVQGYAPQVSAYRGQEDDPDQATAAPILPSVSPYRLSASSPAAASGGNTMGYTLPASGPAPP